MLRTSSDKYYTEYATHIVWQVLQGIRYAHRLTGTTGNTLRTSSGQVLHGICYAHRLGRYYTEYATHIVLAACGRVPKEYASHIV